MAPTGDTNSLYGETIFSFSDIKQQYSPQTILLLSFSLSRSLALLLSRSLALSLLASPSLFCHTVTEHVLLL